MTTDGQAIRPRTVHNIDRNNAAVAIRVMSKTTRFTATLELSRRYAHPAAHASSGAARSTGGGALAGGTDIEVIPNGEVERPPNTP
jgi:hypothetical protein